MFKKLAGVGIGVAIIFGLGLFIGIVFPRIARIASAPQIFNTTAILKQVQTLSQLVTVKYVLEKVVVLEDVKWYGENRVLLVAHGVVKAGTDLSKLQPADVRIAEKKIIVTLPKAAITDVYLDDRRTQILERSTGIMRVFDKDLEQNARRQAVDDLRRAALNNGILNDSEERARAQLSNLFYQLGFTEVDLRSR
jgi:hypothetical protein